ncbi:type II toxin-antitoxin system PemK/MazF family toxin [Fodinicurvata sp. EGI_FJ10296]|uniref:type II toxin-antitoxin system PemK/MazF family toxin n=1 Tax=Fodinicurvata sp. EGI_FJ10296 TaxID=3231908 RepID=UPI003454F8C0
MSPSAGKEQKGKHPALCLSAFQFNKRTGFTFFAPITTVGNASRGNGFAVTLQGTGTQTTGVIQIDQVKAMDWRIRNGARSTPGERIPANLLEDVLERFGPIFGLGLLEADETG